MSELLRQQFELGYTYTRSTGPVVGTFFSGLRDLSILGTRGSDGKVYVPPMEFDPVTAEALDEFVEVSDCGEVISWCWVTEPRASHPMDRPFAWAQIKLDGADVPMLHAVDTGGIEHMATGMRVRAQWSPEPKGYITDIVCFVPEDQES